MTRPSGPDVGAGEAEAGVAQRAAGGVGDQLELGDDVGPVGGPVDGLGGIGDHVVQLGHRRSALATCSFQGPALTASRSFCR